jgi:hypothetical protein
MAAAVLASSDAFGISDVLACYFWIERDRSRM